MESKILEIDELMTRIEFDLNNMKSDSLKVHKILSEIVLTNESHRPDFIHNNLTFFLSFYECLEMTTQWELDLNHAKHNFVTIWKGIKAGIDLYLKCREVKQHNYAQHVTQNS